jgi:hypothetical protein
MRNPVQGVTIKTADETREVMLGLANFITGKGFAFAKGDSTMGWERAGPQARQPARTYARITAL